MGDHDAVIAAMRLIAARSPRAADRALSALHPARVGTPENQRRIEAAIQMALADPGAEWTAEERASLVDVGVPSLAEDDDLQAAARAAIYALRESSGLSSSEIGRLVGRVAHTVRGAGKQPDSRTWRRWQDGDELIPHPLAELLVRLRIVEVTPETVHVEYRR